MLEFLILSLPISRRRVIYLAATIGGAAIITAATGNRFYLNNSSNESKIVTTTKTQTQEILKKTYPKNMYIEGDNSLVSMVQGRDSQNDVPEMIQRSVDLLGGIQKIDVKDKNVLVKPNLNTNNPHPASTNPIVVGTVVKILFDAGASKVTVGDSSNLNNRTKDVMRDQGIQKIVEDAGGDVLFLEDEEFITVQIPKGKWLTETRISKPVLQAERLIDIPIIKSHNVTNYSMSMKNFVGAIHIESRFDPRWEPSTKVFHTCGNPAEAAAELNVLVNPDLVIMDGTKSLISYGNIGDDSGVIQDTNIIVASGDRIANDIVGLSIIKSYGLWPNVVDSDVWEQPTIKRALELELGRDKEKIKILVESLAGETKQNELTEQIHGLSGIKKI